MSDRPTEDEIVDAREVVGEFFRSGCEPAHRHAHFSSLKEADALLTALHAAGMVVEQGWQPRETAPDAAASPQRVLVYDPRLTEAIQIRGADGGFWRYEGVGPTHWRPLPVPPAAKDTET